MHNLHLEGANWDFARSCLCEAASLQFVCNLPVMHFKPVQTAQKTKGTSEKYTDTALSHLSACYVRFLPMPGVLLSAKMRNTGTRRFCSRYAPE